MLNLPYWEFGDNVCGFTSKYLTKLEASVVGAALVSLWALVWAEGTKSKEYIFSVFESVVWRNKLIPKKFQRDTAKTTKGAVPKAPAQGNPKSRTLKGPKLQGLQVFYDGSGCTDPHVGGAGYIILKDGVEEGGGSETIPFGTNNIGEFRGCLNGIKRVVGMGESVEMVGDCKILTEAAPKGCPISNYILNNLLSEIRGFITKFKEVKFTHVLREFNKRADAIATAASWSEEDGWSATVDPAWDPRVKHIETTSEEWIVLHSELWKWLSNPLSEDWSFPVWSPSFIRTCRGLVSVTRVVFFPIQQSPNDTVVKEVPLVREISAFFPEKSKVGDLVAQAIEEERGAMVRENRRTLGLFARGPTSCVRRIIPPLW